MLTWRSAHVKQGRRSLVALAAIIAIHSCAPLKVSNAGPEGRDRDDERADDGLPPAASCRGTSPDCYHTWDTAFRRDTTLRILIYSRTGVSRHAHLGPLLGPGLNPPLADD